MFWIVTSLVGLALAFAKLGALSVMTQVLSTALCLSLLVIAGLVIALVWRKLRRH